MKKLSFFKPLFAVLLSIGIVSQGTLALAGTTGSVTGTLSDSTTGKPVADATVIASSPSETTSAKTDASGHYSFLTLAPDTYSVSATKEGYAPTSQSGVTVFADQTQTVALTTHPADLKTIVKITSRAAGNLVKAGTTSDVYAVNAATQHAVQGIGGGANLDSAYSAIYSQPGVTSQIGNYGFGQVYYIRGSSYSQVGYEFDGIPVNRAFDNYNANSLSNFGTQQTEVYTGGSPAGGASATLGGYINQVIKTGSYPGYASLNAGIGAPSFYHKLAAEAGGATPDRRFSYYAGIYGSNQAYRTFDNQNGGDLAMDGSDKYGLSGYSFNSVATALSNWYTQGPWASCDFGTGAAPTGAATFGGLPACNWYSPLAVTNLGWASDVRDRENVVNFHFGIPHKNGLRDDVQLLFDNYGYQSIFGDSLNDNGGMGYLNNAFNGWGGPNGYASQIYPAFYGQPLPSYTGQGGPYDNTCAFQVVFGYSCLAGPTYLGYVDKSILKPGTAFGQPAGSTAVIPYYSPSSPANRAAYTSVVPAAGRDGLWNDGSVIKVQYQKQLSSNAYARVMGYTFYSDWLQTSQNFGGGGFTMYLPGAVGGGYPSPDYELVTHTRGAELQFGDQINAQHLLTFTANYTTATINRTNNQFYVAPGVFSSYADANGNCYNKSGAVRSCLSSSTQNQGANLQPFTAPAGSAAAQNNAQWIVTRPGGYGTFNSVVPKFTSIALQDEFRPNDKLDLNLGLRFEQYQYDLANLNTQEFGFWFKSAASSYCYDPDTLQPLLTSLKPGQSPALAGPVIAPNLVTGEQAGLCYNSAGVALMNAAGHQYRHPNGQSGSLLYTNVGVPTITKSEFSPRIGGTYTVSHDTVLRFTAGRYTQPTQTAYEQYSNLSGYGAAKFDFTHFFGLGFLTPVHNNPVQTSNNIDFSIEHQIHGTDISLKLSPFYRYTTNQLVTVSLGGNFASAINAGTQKTEGVELAIQKGDPNRNGLSGQLSYTYTNAKIKYSTLANGTNSIDALNNYIIAYNQLTSFCKNNPSDARCGNIASTATANIAPCYAADGNGPNGTNSADPTCAATSITNPYYNAPVQGLMDRNGWYPTYANNPPYTAPDGVFASAFGPNTFAGWLNYKHDKIAVALNAQLNQGSPYGSPTTVLGLDPRTCLQNQAAAGAVASSSPYAQNADYQSCLASTFFTPSGNLAVPNPTSGKFDGMGQYQEPWEFNLGMQVSYDVSPRVTTTLTLASLVNRCFGGTGGSWTKAYPANNLDCGWGPNGGSYIGAVPGSGFFYGASGADPANGTAGYPNWMNQPYAPGFSLARPFQAYLQVQVKL